MEQVCHRCGDTLNSDNLYCPHCGAPQLRVEESESVLAAQEGSAQHALDRTADMIRWRAAVKAALTVAIPAALLSSALSLGALWVFIGGILVVSVYRRRTASSADGNLGWRIGGLMGTMAAIFWLIIEAASMAFERFVLHRQPWIISIMKKSLHGSIAAVNKQNPAFAHQYPWFSHFWLSPDGIASFMLISSSMLALSMILFSAIGGAIGGRYMHPRPTGRPRI